MKKRAIIVDLDGTLVNNTERIDAALELHKNSLHSVKVRWDDIYKDTDKLDTPNAWCMEIVRNFNIQGYKILFLTGRAATKATKEATMRWIDKYVSAGVDYELIMRPEKDFRKNHIVKKQTIEDKILPTYDVLFAIDDHSENANMMRDMGITCLHCMDYTEPGY